MQIVRNPEACCGNCPFWDGDNAKLITGKNQKGDVVETRKARCHDGQPASIHFPVAAKQPAIATPGQVNGAQQMRMHVEWVQFDPPEGHWCSHHPLILMQVNDDNPPEAA